MATSRPVILMTGSSGFLGEAIRDAFDDHFVVVGLDRDPPHRSSPDEFITADLTSDASVRDAVRLAREHHGARIAAVIHLAAYYDFSGEPSPLYDQVTVRGTQRLLRALRDQQFDVGQFIFSSTMLVHAPCQPGQRINEDWPLDAKWDYPKSKLQTEELIAAERGDIPAVIFRIAGVYDDDCHSIPLANQMQRIYERRLTAKVFPGDVSAGQSFVHLDDLVSSVSTCVDRRRDLPEWAVLLIGEDETLSYDELQRMFAWLIHQERDWDTTQIPKAVAKAGAWVQDAIPGIDDPFIKPWMIDLADDHYELDITRARQSLGWNPRRTLRQTLPVMVDHLKADPAGFYERNKLKGDPPSPADRPRPRAVRAG